MKSELEHFIEKHFSNNENPIFCDEDDSISKMKLEKIRKFILSLISLEKPDMYSKIDNELLFIEHFIFDASLWTERGSLEKKEFERVRKKEEEFFKNKQLSTSFSDKINSKTSFKNLVANVEKVFNNHINKIPTYVERLKKEKLIDSNTKLYKCFLIESGSKLPLYTNKKRGLEIFNLFYADFFINILEKHLNKIDGLFYSFSGQKESILYFMDIKAFSIYKKKCVKLDENNFISIEPMVIASRIFVKEEIRTEISDVKDNE